MRENILKSVLAVILAGAAVYFRKLLGPLIILGVVMIADYITGMTAAWITKTLSSRAGILGVVKKICYLFAVAVAIVVDYVIWTAVVSAKPDTELINFFGLLVTVWLILNECISILENLSEIGVPLPGFLMAIVKRLKKSAENKGNEAAEEIAPLRPESGTDTDADAYASFGVNGSLPLPFDDDVSVDHPQNRG